MKYSGYIYICGYNVTMQNMCALRNDQVKAFGISIIPVWYHFFGLVRRLFPLSLSLIFSFSSMNNTFSFSETIMPPLVFITHIYIFLGNNFTFWEAHMTMYLKAPKLRPSSCSEPNIVPSSQSFKYLISWRCLLILSKAHLTPHYFLDAGSPNLLD